MKALAKLTRTNGYRDRYRQEEHEFTIELSIVFRKSTHQTAKQDQYQQRVKELIEAVTNDGALEVCPVTTRSERSDLCHTCGVDAKTVTIGSSCECEVTQ